MKIKILFTTVDASGLCFRHASFRAVNNHEDIGMRIDSAEAFSGEYCADCDVELVAAAAKEQELKKLTEPSVAQGGGA